MEVLPQLTTLGIVLVLFLQLASCQVSDGTVKCYVCSFSPKENRTDEWCTDDNFNPNMAQTMDCPQGCEYVYSYDINNKLELFHRNCYSYNSTNALRMGCKEGKTLAYSRRQCVCFTDYCNEAATAVAPHPHAAILFAILAFLWPLKP